MQTLKFGFGALVVAVLAAACGTSAGGGWIPSAADPAKKATFGFNYSCDSSTNRVQGHLVYHDHGTGHKAVVEIDQPIPSEVSCTTFLGGATAACGVVKNGSGGVSTNDIVLVGTVDGKPAASADQLAIIMFPASSTTLTGCNGATQSCSSATNIGDFLSCLIGDGLGSPYYSNSGALGGGNITWTE